MVLAVGCKKSVKGEESRWKAANKTVDELAVVYPSFKAVLDEQRATAKKLYDAAQGIEDKKKKISALSAANKALTLGFVGQLSGVETKIKGLRSKLVAAAGTADPAMKSKVKAARKEVNRTLDDVKRRLKRGATSAKEATILVSKITNDLVGAEQIVAQVTPAPKKPATTKATKAAGGAGAAVAVPAKKAEPAKWTCEFCDHSNEGKAHTCSNCGAKRGSKKK